MCAGANAKKGLPSVNPRTSASASPIAGEGEGRRQRRNREGVGKIVSSFSRPERGPLTRGAAASVRAEDWTRLDGGQEKEERKGKKVSSSAGGNKRFTTLLGADSLVSGGVLDLLPKHGKKKKGGGKEISRRPRWKKAGSREQLLPLACARTKNSSPTGQ